NLLFLIFNNYFTFFISFFFFFNDTATTEIYTLSLHDALPISGTQDGIGDPARGEPAEPLREDEQQDQPQPEHRHGVDEQRLRWLDRKSTRLNSSHLVISYAVFCLKKKKKKKKKT